MRTLDYLPNTDIYLYQDRDMFRVNSDTRYLGEFIEIKTDDVVLDVGTNNGALLLYANKLGCKKLVGVDINESAIELCKENMIYNKISSYELYSCKVQDLNIDKVDVVISNPPYFKTGIRNNNKDLKVARHEESLTLEELISNSKRLLNDNGKLMLVYRSNEMGEIFSLLNKYKFGITRIQFIHDENKDFASGILVEAILNRKNNVKVLKPIMITH